MFSILCQIMRQMQNMHPTHIYCAGSKHKITTEMLALFALEKSLS